MAVLFDARIISGITVFVSVAKTGSYTRAASQIGLSRSGVGKAIARLEERTHMRLFDRTSRASKLTGEGRAFLDEVLPILERLDHVAAPATAREVRGRLRVTSDAAFGKLLLPALSQIVATHSNLKIDLLIQSRVDNLIAEGIDCAFRFGEHETRGMDRRLITTGRLITCATPAYVARHSNPMTPQDLLQEHRCVRLFDEASGKTTDWTFARSDGRAINLTPDCSITINDLSSMIYAALDDYGVIQVVDFLVDEHIRDGRLIELLPEWNSAYRPIYLYTPRTERPSISVDAFVAFISSFNFPHTPMPTERRELAVSQQ